MLQRIDEAPVTRQQKLLSKFVSKVELEPDSKRCVPLLDNKNVKVMAIHGFSNRLARSTDPSRLTYPNSNNPIQGPASFPSLPAARLCRSNSEAHYHTGDQRLSNKQHIDQCWQHVTWYITTCYVSGIGDQTKDSSDRRCQREATTCPVTWEPRQGFRCTEDKTVQISSSPYFTSQCQLGKMEEERKPSSACRLCDEKQCTLANSLNHFSQAQNMLQTGYEVVHSWSWIDMQTWWKTLTAHI